MTNRNAAFALLAILLASCSRRVDTSAVAFVEAEDFISCGRFQDGILRLEKAIGMTPETEYPSAEMLLAEVLAGCPRGHLRDGQRARCMMEKYEHTKIGEGWRYQTVMACIYAELGDFESAVQCQERAIRTYPSGYSKPLDARLLLYRRDRPYRGEHGFLVTH